MDSGTKIESATAESLLATGADHLRQRAATRDLPQERSMKRAVTAFNVLFGPQLKQGSVTEVMGWQFMAVLKMARASAGSHNLDDYVDQAAYSALAGECAEQGHRDREEHLALTKVFDDHALGIPLKADKEGFKKVAKKPAAKKQGSRGRS